MKSPTLAKNFDSLLSQLLDRIGDWNPQLFRELKGRLKLRNIALVVGLAVIVQIFFLAIFWLQLPPSEPIEPNYPIQNAYCIGQQAYNYTSNFTCTIPVQINWQTWWLAQFQLISWLLPVAPAAIGSAFLAIDIAQESQRGTLNFIRLSPQSSGSILLGKLLGVPSLVYLLVLAAIPLHLVTAIGGGVSPVFLVSYYLMVGLGWGLLHSVALLSGLMVGARSGNQLFNPINAGVSMGAISLGFIQSYMGLNLLTTWARYSSYLTGSSYNFPIEWFRLPISANVAIANIFGVITMLVGIQGVWYALDRSFNLPNRPLLSKRQSYICLGFFELFALGFLVRSGDAAMLRVGGLLMLNSLNFVAFLALIVILTPQRQTLLDWARYRHTKVEGRSLWQELIWSENSPAPVAIAVNAAIATLVLLPWIVFGNTAPSTPEVLLIMVSQALAFLVYAVIYQSIMFWAKTKKQQGLAIAALGFLVFLPAAILFVFGISRAGIMPELWVLVGYPAAVFNSGGGLSFIFVGAIATQVGVLSFASLKLKNTLQKAGASEFKQLSESTLELSPRS